MRMSLFRHRLAVVPNGKKSLSFLRGCGWSGWGLVLAGVLAVLMTSTGCDPKPPPTDDLGTVLGSPPEIPEAREPYQLPENVAKAKEKWDRENAGP